MSKDDYLDGLELIAIDHFATQDLFAQRLAEGKPPDKNQIAIIVATEAILEVAVHTFSQSN